MFDTEKNDDILRKRIDVNKEDEKIKDKSKHVVTFIIGGEEYAINIMLVIEIIKVVKSTPVPLALDFIDGVVNLRGNVVPVVDLKKRFSIKTLNQGNIKDERIIVVEIAKKTIGFKVDKVKEVISIPESRIDPTPSMISSISQIYFEGVAKYDDRLIIMLNIEKLLSESELEKVTNKY